MSTKSIKLYRQTWKDPQTGDRRESPHWSYVIHFAGKRFRGTTNQTLKTLAQETAEDELRKVERAYAGLPVEESVERIRTVNQALGDYTTIYAANQRPRALRLVQDRSKALRRILGSCLLSEINDRKVSEYVSRRLKDGLGPRTVNIEVGILARALGQTRRYLWPKVKPLREPKDVGRALNDDEVGRVLAAAAENKSPYIRLAILIALTTGMRIGEIEGLTWGAVDFSRNELRVGRSKTAAGEGRVIPMNGDLRAALEMHGVWYARRFGELRRDWFLFPLCRTKRPADPARSVTRFQTAWVTVKDAAGVTCRFHDLRHTAASRMGRGGASRAAMMRVMGHASQALVDRYCHAEERDVRAAVEALLLAKPGTDCHSGRHSDASKPESSGSEVLSIQ